MAVTRQFAAESVAAALAAEACCEPTHFRTEGVRVFEMTADRAANPLARRFPVLDDSLTVASMGAGVVVDYDFGMDCRGYRSCSVNA